MSEALRIALVAEGPTEREVMEAALKVILAPRTFILTQLQPEATKPAMGNGWGGVLKWCQQLANRCNPHGGTVDDDPTLSIFDGVVLHLDADVANFAYTDLRPPFTNEEAAERGWMPLPCTALCPPANLFADDLFAVLLSWLSPATPGAKTVVCIPAMNTGAWHAAAKLPNGHDLLVDLECNNDIELRLKGLPLALRVDKGKRQSRLDAAAAVTQHWAIVTERCARADAFQNAILAAFPNDP